MKTYRNPGTDVVFLAPENLKDQIALRYRLQERKLDVGMDMTVKDKYKKYAKKYGR